MMINYLRFRLGQDWYAAGVRQVVEVLPLVTITPLPESPSYRLGVLTLRGQAVNVFDLRQLLGKPLAPIRVSTPLVILRPSHGSLIAVLVDEVDNVVRLPELEPLAGAGRLLVGMARVDETPLLILHVDALADVLQGAAGEVSEG